jgi:hypothetical protein
MSATVFRGVAPDAVLVWDEIHEHNSSVVRKYGTMLGNMRTFIA